MVSNDITGVESFTGQPNQSHLTMHQTIGLTD